MIQLHQSYRGQAKQAAAAIWGSSASVLRYKNIWVVDEDIDIHDYGALDWAFAYRVNAADDDIVIYPATIGSQLDPSVRYRDRDKELFGGGKRARVLIDATMNLDHDPSRNMTAIDSRPTWRRTPTTWRWSSGAGRNTGWNKISAGGLSTARANFDE